MEKVIMSWVSFSKDSYHESELADISEYKPKRISKAINWINIHGIHDSAIMELVGKQFSLDKMVLEDIVNTNHRPKAEELDDYLFVTLKALKPKDSKGEISVRQISLILGPDWLLTFQEGGSDTFKMIKEKVRSAKGNIWQRGEDYIFYRLIDMIVDNYFLVTDSIGDTIEELEEKLIQDPDESLDEEIYYLKKKISLVKKDVVPLREAISTILRSENESISENTQKYFRDVYEHLIHVIETINTQHETLNDFLNMYMSGLSNKMNEVMKVLTIFASIFIPLTFIAGVYGMNFRYMPELQSEHGYFVTWGVMIAVAAALLLYFRKKKWL
jgi:magnesium transporter